MAYIQVEEANVTTLDQARSGDVDAVLVRVRGEEVFTLAAMITTEEARPAGKCFEDARGDLWFALQDDVIQQIGDGQPAQMSASALRVCGWNL